MSLAYIQQAYGVEAKRGGRVRYTGGKVEAFGTITGASGGHIEIRLDGQRHSNPYHPTWELEYLPAGGEADPKAGTARQNDPLREEI